MKKMIQDGEILGAALAHDFLERDHVSAETSRDQLRRAKPGDDDYRNARAFQCRWLANRTRKPAVRSRMLDFALHYERLAGCDADRRAYDPQTAFG